MRREVLEETGLTVTQYDFKGVISFINDLWEDEYMMLFEATGYEGSLKEDCPEGTLRWIPFPQILSLPLWEGDRIFLQDLMKGKEKINRKLVYQGDRLISWD